MMSFNNYLLYRRAAEKIGLIARRIVEQQQQQQPQQPQQGQQGQSQAALDNAKNLLMRTFEQEFQKDPKSALTWLNNLYTQVLPKDYEAQYNKWQEGQKKNQPNQQQGQGQGQQQQGQQGQGQQGQQGQGQQPQQGQGQQQQQQQK
jgi:hypothetical protein